MLVLVLVLRSNIHVSSGHIKSTPFYYQSSFTRLTHIFDDILDFKMTTERHKMPQNAPFSLWSLFRPINIFSWIYWSLLVGNMYLCKLYETSRWRKFTTIYFHCPRNNHLHMLLVYPNRFPMSSNILCSCWLLFLIKCSSTSKYKNIITYIIVVNRIKVMFLTCSGLTDV